MSNPINLNDFNCYQDIILRSGGALQGGVPEVHRQSVRDVHLLSPGDHAAVVVEVVHLGCGEVHSGLHHSWDERRKRMVIKSCFALRSKKRKLFGFGCR